MMSQRGTGSDNKVAFEDLKTQLLSSQFKPRKRKRKKLHSKNPFKIKNYDYMLLEEHRRAKPRVKMDGFYIMKISKAEVPHEVVKLKLNGKNIHEVVNDDLKFFNNLNKNVRVLNNLSWKLKTLSSKPGANCHLLELMLLIC